MAFMWLLMLAPKSMKGLLPVFDRIGPFFWLVPLATIVLAGGAPFPQRTTYDFTGAALFAF